MNWINPTTADQSSRAKRAKLLGFAALILCWCVWLRFGSANNANNANNPLADVVEGDDVKAAAALLQSGADPNYPYVLPDSKIRSAFWIDASNRWRILEPVAAYFDHPQQESLLFVAARHNNTDMVRVLLERGAKPNQSGDDMAYVLLDQDVKTNKFENDRTSALTIASSNGNAAMVKMLLAAGANVNYQNKFNSSPLGSAVSSMDENEQGASANEATILNRWVGQKSDKSDYLETIRLLIAAKANVNTKMGWGWDQTPLQFARTHKLKSVASLLAKAGAR